MKQTYHPSGAAISLLAAILAPCAFAAPDDAPATMAKVEIVGIAPLYGLGIERDLLPYPVQAASDTVIRQSGDENLSEFMARKLSGVNINEVSGSPFQNDITFRGFRASPVLGSSQGISVYLDGVRVNEPFGDVINWDMIPEAALASVVLVPGANPLFGLNTLGGALAFTTKSGLTHPGGEAELSLTDAGRRRADLAYGWRQADGWHGFLGSTLFDDEGWRDYSSGHLANVFIKLGRSQGATDWSASLLGGRSRLLGNGLLPELLYRDDRRAVYTHPDTTRNRLVQGTVSLAHRFSTQTELSAVAYARNSRRDTVNGDASEDYDDYVEDCEDGFDDDGAPIEPDECGFTRAQGAALHSGVLNTTSTRQDSQGASIAITARRGMVRFDAGASLDHSDVEYAQYEQEAFVTPEREVIGDDDEATEFSSGVTGKSRTASVYAAANMAFSADTHLSASLRFNRARVTNTLTNEDGPQPIERFTYSRLNPSLGLTHRIHPQATLFANAGQSNRVPTVIELGCADPDHPCRLPVGLQADPYLKQIVARTLEAGVRGRFSGGAETGSYTVSLHRTVSDDDILFFSSPSRQGYFANFERTRRQGLDAMVERQFGPLSLQLSYNYLQAEYDADGELFTGARNVAVRRGTPIAGLPRHTAKLAMAWNATSQLDVGAELHVVSSLITQGNEDGLVEDPEEDEEPARANWRIPGHGLLTLRASYRPAPGWELFARISNLLDRRYETFGAVAPDLFPHGQLIKPHEAPGDAANALFVAPGAPRTFVAGLRYRF
jgi:outer membrane receptor protein involved in Fe transport